MKTIIIVIAFLIMGGLASAQTYTAVTPDNEASTVEAVQVKEAKATTTETVYTLQAINTQIAVLQAQKVNINAEIDKWQALKVAVKTEADKVKLKK
jgi:hypothetical protein